MRGRGLELDRCRNFFMDAVYDFVLAWAVVGAEELNLDFLLDEVGEALPQWHKRAWWAWRRTPSFGYWIRMAKYWM